MLIYYVTSGPTYEALKTSGRSFEGRMRYFEFMASNYVEVEYVDFRSKK